MKGALKNTRLKCVEREGSRAMHWTLKISAVEPPPWKQAMRGREFVMFGTCEIANIYI